MGNGGDGGARADEDGDAELAEACNVLSELPSSPAARIALAAATATRGEPAAGLAHAELTDAVRHYGAPAATATPAVHAARHVAAVEEAGGGTP